METKYRVGFMPALPVHDRLLWARMRPLARATSQKKKAAATSVGKHTIMWAATVYSVAAASVATQPCPAMALHAETAAKYLLRHVHAKATKKGWDGVLG